MKSNVKTKLLLCAMLAALAAGAPIVTAKDAQAINPGNLAYAYCAWARVTYQQTAPGAPISDEVAASWESCFAD